MLFRVIRVHDWSTYDGWAWLDGYELNVSGDAVDRRSIFVQVSGLQKAHVNVPARTVTRHIGINDSAARRRVTVPTSKVA